MHKQKMSVWLLIFDTISVDTMFHFYGISLVHRILTFGASLPSAKPTRPRKVVFLGGVSQHCRIGAVQLNMFTICY